MVKSTTKYNSVYKNHNVLILCGQTDSDGAKKISTEHIICGECCLSSEQKGKSCKQISGKENLSDTTLSQIPSNPHLKGNVPV